MNGESVTRPAARVTSSVMFVSRLDPAIEFYRDVFSCSVGLREPGAALLLTPDGFQIYLIARGTRAEHPSGGIGHQYLIWAVSSEAELREMAVVLADRHLYPDQATSGGVSFVTAHDPDGIRIVVAHPGPQRLPRSIVAARLYA